MPTTKALGSIQTYCMVMDFQKKNMMNPIYCKLFPSVGLELFSLRTYCTELQPNFVNFSHFGINYFAVIYEM